MGIKTVQDLIDALNKIENKEQVVHVAVNDDIPMYDAELSIGEMGGTIYDYLMIHIKRQ
jgi:hypothetical protein